MTYIIDGFLKHAELDDYLEGCDPKQSFSHMIDIKLTADSREDLIQKLMHHFDVNREGLELDACEEAGRVDIQIMENREAEKATAEEHEEFKHGECDLWLCTYSGQLEFKPNTIWVEPKKEPVT